MIVKTTVKNKPSSLGLVMKESWDPMCSKEGSLGAKLRQGVTMNGWDWMRMWRMKMKQGRKGRRWLSLSPNSPRCYAGKGKWQDCSGQSHWTTGCMCARGTRDDETDKTEQKHCEGDY